jgi:hypothetical protein
LWNDTWSPVNEEHRIGYDGTFTRHHRCGLVSNRL